MKWSQLLLAALLVAGTASAQSFTTTSVKDIVLLPDGRYLNVQSHLFTDASGNILGTEAYPFYDQIISPVVLIGPGSPFSAGTADSNAVPIDTHRMGSGTLYLKFWRTATGVGTVAHFAIQVRGHLNAGTDSTSIGVLYPDLNVVSTTMAATAGSDTLSQGQVTTGSATLLWSGEWDQVVDLARGSPLSGTVVVPFQYPNMIVKNLARLYGPSLGIQYMSVRVRQLSGPACFATVTFEGRP